MSFNQQFDQHGAWRREFALRLKLLSEWMKGHDLLNAAVEERLLRLESQVRSDKVMVAFVAEFSRGKSELINAIFFAGYGRRIMPASAGRTTMCPTELGYDADSPPCLRLLPIETRLKPQALMEWRMVPEKWTRVDLDVNDPVKLSKALEKVAEVRHVTQDEARALGFWHDDAPQDNPRVNADGLVEVPKWRHALINIAHPLLKQGLVILDTPGLNAIGAEPELTVSLIPQAHAVVFILAADTGVTKSDLAIWREHLITEGDDNDARLVVLNKIDTLWDALSSPAQIQAQIDRQRASSAEILGLPVAQVIPVSAQKGLVAKVTGDDKLLQASCLPGLELALAQGVMGQRQKILRSAVAAGIVELRAEAGRVIHIRRRDLAEQMIELRGLRGKNDSVIKHMRSRIEQEQVEFNASGAKIQAVRSIHLKLLREVFHLLGTPTLKTELAELTDALKQPGIKLGVKKAYGQTFARLREGLQKAQTTSADIQRMLGGSFKQLNAEFGFSLQAPKEPEMSRFLVDLEQIERSHLQYLGVANILKLAQPDFSERLVRALATRLRVVYETALGEVELWNKSAASQLDAQLKERRKNFSRRIEAIERIQQAATGLDERIAEIAAHERALDELDGKLDELTDQLVHAPASPHDPALAAPAAAMIQAA
ncbi:MAG: dynamin family protein [Polaromonas sp.]|uniref:dynamin family protein n=1 Tax=Polaromonas sp. TaxID=1869339 RepID=UPI0027232CBA|nr:dynamin family protein [Polaromonas sp.]MDO9115437.1 dynamin family protein [Polaromonas sp.]MDP1885188.1 dynamin family protein [Polaromonas sp.]